METIGKIETGLRWTFAGFLVLAFTALTFRIPGAFTTTQQRRPFCDVQFTRDVEETASINLGPLARVRNFVQAFRQGRLACYRDPSLKTVNVRANCPRADGSIVSVSRMVFCP